MAYNKELIAFIHIEKAAGQTFIGILEKNFSFRHCRVAPFKKKSAGTFSAEDLKILLRINPFVKAISGHSIKPYSNLDKVCPGIKYITILREPAERYISHYQYWVQEMNYSVSFEDFLDIQRNHNFQTRKIAGEANLDKAQSIISEKVFLTGVLDKFEVFLEILKTKLNDYNFYCRYTKKNVARSNRIKQEILENYEKYKDRIYENNTIDIELYKFVKKNFFEDARKILSNRTHSILNEKSSQLYKHDLVGRAFRKFYYGPILYLIRYLNGLPPKGSY